MPRAEKKRVATDAAEAARPGLNPAFAALDLPDLPAAPALPAEPAPVWKMGRVILRRETAHRGGKTVLVIHDFATHLPAAVLERIAKKLRAACGCGGAVKERTIELQGDQPARVRAALEAEGFQVAGVR